ncbi:hypothetical protein ACFE04_017035 [Oxalis oulophora]
MLALRQHFNFITICKNTKTYTTLALLANLLLIVQGYGQGTNGGFIEAYWTTSRQSVWCGTGASKKPLHGEVEENDKEDRGEEYYNEKESLAFDRKVSVVYVIEVPLGGGR